MGLNWLGVATLFAVGIHHFEPLLTSDCSGTDREEAVPGQTFNDRPDKSQPNVVQSNLKEMKKISKKN